MRKKIAIVDYGVGNLRSIIRAFERLEVDIVVTEESEQIMKSDAIVLPGDGTFKAGMDGLKVRNLITSIKNFTNSGKPVLGICLGAQILLSEGYEFGKKKGLSIIDGKVNSFPSQMKEKVPHIGWNQLAPPKGKSWKHTILENIKPGSYMYFIHSYIMKPSKSENILASTNYGENTFASLVKKENIYGCQFHPEKSGSVGLEIINNFIKLIQNEQT